MGEIELLVAVFVGSVLLSITGCVLGLMGLLIARRIRAEIAALRREREGRPTAPQQTPLAAEAIVQTAIVPPELVVIESAPLIGPVVARAAKPRRPAMDIELLLTQRWGMWVGAIALLLAGCSSCGMRWRTPCWDPGCGVR